MYMNHVGKDMKEIFLSYLQYLVIEQKGMKLDSSGNLTPPGTHCVHRAISPDNDALYIDELATNPHIFYVPATSM